MAARPRCDPGRQFLPGPATSPGAGVYFYKIQAGNRVEAQAEIPVFYYLSSPVWLETIAVAYVNDKATELQFTLSNYGILFNPPEKISLRYYTLQGELLRTQLLYQDTGAGSDLWKREYTCSLEKAHKVVIEVIYRDGRRDSGEIWPEPQYMLDVKEQQKP